MPTNRGGFLIRFDEDQRASFLHDVRSLEEGFSDALSQADWAVEQWEVCGLMFEPETVTHWALALVRMWFRTVAFIDARQGEPGRTGAEIIVRELNKGSGAQFTLDDFWRFWNKYEHYPASIEAAETDILNEGGRNYWKLRWDDCNGYFLNVKHTIKRPVDPEAAFWMPRLHARLKAINSAPK